MPAPRPLMAEPDQTARDLQLAWRIREGDEDAFRTLFETYYEPLCDFVERGIGHAADAEDLVEDLFVRLWRRRQDWWPRASVRAYLYAAARYKTASYHRRRAAHPERFSTDSFDDARALALLSGAPDPTDAMEADDLRRHFLAAVDALPARRRAVFVLARWHGLTYAEIAAALGIAEKTVENQMGHALRQLRRRLAAFLPSLL